MKAIAYDRYGPLEALAPRDTPTPAVKDGEVLVHVRAAGLPIGYVFSVRGAPYGMRLYSGLLKPKHGVPGYDLAGQVEAAGSASNRQPWHFIAVDDRAVTASPRAPVMLAFG